LNSKVIFWLVLLGCLIFYVLVPYNVYFEDSWGYFLWYKHQRDIELVNEPVLTLLFRVFPRGLTLYGFKILFGSFILVLFSKCYRSLYAYRIWPLMLLLANPVFLDLLFNLSRSTIAILFLILVIKSRRSDKWSAISLLIHNKVGLIYTAFITVYKYPLILLIALFLYYRIGELDFSAIEAYRRFGWYNITLSNQLIINISMLLIPYVFMLTTTSKNKMLEFLATVSLILVIIFYLLDSNYFYRFLITIPLISWLYIKEKHVVKFASFQVLILILGFFN
jgi:hypothetical protein